MRAVGLSVLAVAVVSFICLLVNGAGGLVTHRAQTLYAPNQMLLPFGVGIAGSLLIAGRFVTAALATVCLLCAQLAGAGTFAFRHWIPWGGMTGADVNAMVVRPLALIMALASLGALCVCLVTLMRRHDFAIRSAGQLGLSILAGAALTFGAALLLTEGLSVSFRILVAVTLMYFAPWGVSLAVSALLTRGPALALISAVCVSISLLMVEDARFYDADVIVQLVACLLVAALVGAARLLFGAEGHQGG